MVPSAATWALQPGKLNTPRYSHASVAFAGKIWIAGGYDNDGNKLSSVEVYDTVTKKWDTIQSMTRRRSSFKLAVVGGEIYAVGGEGYASIEKLDKGLGVWRVVAEIGESRVFCGVCAVGPKIYVMGGRGLDSTWNAFDVNARQWASANTSVEDRTLPRDFVLGQALTVPP